MRTHGPELNSNGLQEFQSIAQIVLNCETSRLHGNHDALYNLQRLMYDWYGQFYGVICNKLIENVDFEKFAESQI